MKKLLIFAVAICLLQALSAEEHSYVWDTEFAGAEGTPKSDFTTADGLFSFVTDKAEGVSGPCFLADSHNLLLRLYAKNTLSIACLNGEVITHVEFVIGSNGNADLAELTPSSGKMLDPYLGNSAAGYKEYRQYWQGSVATVVFVVGDSCAYGYDCLQNGKSKPGTLMTKQIIITTAPSTRLDEPASVPDFSQPMLNILGVPVDRTYKGIVIQNGRKYILR